MILDNVCENLDLLSMMVYVKKVLYLIEVAGPIAVIFAGGLDILHAVTAHDQDGIQKNIRMIPKRLLLCAVLLLMPVIVSFIINTVDITNNISTCFDKADPAYIEGEYERIAVEAIQEAESQETYVTYTYAQKCVDKITDDNLKRNYEKRLKDLKQKIDDKNKIKFPELHFNGGDGGTVSGSSNEVVKYAEQYLGLPYVWGGTSLESGADCSGFVQSVFKHFGVNLPRIADDQAKCNIGTAVNGLENAKAGDLIFFDWDHNGVYDHVALYAGNNTKIHASGDEGCPNGPVCKVVEDQRSMSCVGFIRRIIKD